MIKLIIATGLVLIAIAATSGVVAKYKLERDYTKHWELADKASTIEAKLAGITQFVTALEQGFERRDFATHNALWMETANNSFEANLAALKSLQQRLEQIREMDPRSFEYNTAIQQITAQEQGEAEAMMKGQRR